MEAAYKQIPVHPSDWPLLGFKWEGKWYCERVLPFGLRSSCRLIIALAWELYAAALELHHLFDSLPVGRGQRHVIHYVDDFLFVAEFEPQAAKILLRRALALCRTLGLPMADSKTEGPYACNKLTFLGIEIDTITMRAAFKLPTPKLDELNILTSDWESKSSKSYNHLLVYSISLARW